MSDSKKPRPGQPQYLPRAWKPAGEPAADNTPVGPDTPKKKKKKAVDSAAPVDAPKKKKKKVEAEASDDGIGGPKLEETPLLDTYEARQRVRLAIGAVVSLVALVLLIVIVKRFQGSAPETDKVVNSEPKVVVDPKESAEKEAAVLLDSARQQDKLGRTRPALALLLKVTRNYDGTAAAREAAGALDRDRRNRPLFEVEEAKKPAASTVAGDSPTPNAVTTAVPTPPPVAPQPPPPPPIVARALPNDYRAETSAGLHPSGWPLRIIGHRDGMTLVLVPGDEFLMGRDDGESSERPAHRVRLGTFYIDQHEVTNRLYQNYLKETGRNTETIAPERLDLPVVAITASEARSYCQWANRRLPTEAQWELAARSSDGRIGYGAALKVNDPKAPLRPAMTESADRSPFGGFDMATNAAEWTSDYFDPNFFRQAGPLSIEPAGPRTSRVKPPLLVVKGHSPTGILTDREGVAVSVRQPYLGFRGVLPVETLTAPTANNAGAGSTGTPGAGVPPDSASGVTPF